MVELLRWRAQEQRDIVAFRFLLDGKRETEQLTYGQLDHQARAVAARLQSLQVAGERILLMLPTGWEYLVAFFACLYAGAIAVPAYPPRPNRSLDRLDAIIADAQPKVIFTGADSPAKRKLLESLNNAPILLEVAALTDSSDPWLEPDIGADTLAFLQYTSGSTASPKGVMVSHGNILYNCRMIAEALQPNADIRFLSWLPLFHDMGLIGSIFAPLYGGYPSLLMSSDAFLMRPLRWLQAISDHRITWSVAPNFAYELCVRKSTPEQRAKLDLSSWRIALNGAEPVRSETLSRFSEAFAEAGFQKAHFYPCYGLAEATLFVAGGLPEAEPVIRPSPSNSLSDGNTLLGCGRCWLQETVIVVDPDTAQPCAAGTIGEIWISGPNVAAGYWRQPELTQQTFHAYLADDADRHFLRTGDLGFIKDDELSITGRLKHLIIIGGRNIHAEDIERTVLHKAILRSAVVPLLPFIAKAQSSWSLLPKWKGAFCKRCSGKTATGPRLCSRYDSQS